MSSQNRKSRRKRSLLPRFSTIALLLVLGGAYYFFHEMYLVRENVADQEQSKIEQEIVKNKSSRLINAINNALADKNATIEVRAQNIQKDLDKAYLSMLDTLMLRNNRYTHLRTTIEEEIVLPQTVTNGDSTKIPQAETILKLLEAYDNLEESAIVDSCVAITRDLITNNK